MHGHVAGIGNGFIAEMNVESTLIRLNSMRNQGMPRFTSFDTKTRIRLRATAYAASDYFINVLLLSGFAAAGAVSPAVPLTVLGIAVAFNAIFMGSIMSGLTRRFRDPSITGIQVLAACGINLLGLVIAPQIAYMFIVNLFVPLSYSSLYFKQRAYLRTWLLLSCALGAVMLMAGQQAALAPSTPIERLLFWIVIAFALGRCLAINAEVSRLRARLQRNNHELADATAKLTDLASRDELTGLWNRREFMRLLQDESRRAVRNRTGFSVAMIDIDHFKQVNDRFGHLTGDKVLHEIACLFDEKRRATDTVARYGGEEFTVLLVNAKASTAMVALERLRNDVAQHDWPGIAPDLQLTISAGVAVWQPGETLTQVLNRADAALYQAKSDGRNCVRISQFSASQPA
jgi:diguanylate cyclase (GGDEF)-like protein